MEYRVEDKYLITEDQIAYIKTKLKECMSLDPNMKGDSYLIRSIYFDDMYDSCLMDNESGVDNREKFRIRTYDNNPELVRLELKGKMRGYTSKKSVVVDKEFAFNYKATPNIDADPLLKKFWAMTQMNRLSPVNIVEYERTAYICKIGNVRITFDRNIGYSSNIEKFFEENISAIPVLPLGQHILEIKYDELLPDYIKETINVVGLDRTSFSKYYYSRKPQTLYSV